jgi:solute carrier family 35 protein C2
MLISLLPFAIVFESARLFEHATRLFDMDGFEILALWIKISIGAFLAFFMEISEFLVLSQTSSLTLSVSGIFKEICQLVLAVEINNEQLSLYNLIGLVLCLGGITSHVIYKYWMMTDNTPERLNSVDSNESHYDLNNQYSTKFDKRGNGSGSGGLANGNVNEIKSSTTNGTSVVIAYNAGNQKAPLLNYDGSDTEDDDENEMDSKSAEVLFDILKRREETRK